MPGYQQTRSALIVVDMQRYFTQPSFPLTRMFARQSPEDCAAYLTRVHELVVPNIRRLLAFFRDKRFPVLFTTLGSETDDGSDLPHWLRSINAHGLGILGSPLFPPVRDGSWQLDEALARTPDEVVLQKRSAGAFATTDLARRLADAGVQAVVIAGVLTDVCVSTTAREAADRNFQVVVVGDACATFGAELQRANLASLEVFGRVRTTAEVLAALRTPLRAA